MEEIFIVHISEEQLITNVNKTFINFNNNKSNHMKYQGKRMSRHFLKEDTQMTYLKSHYNLQIKTNIFPVGME